MLLIDGLASHPTDCKPLKGPIFDCISLPTHGSQRLVDAEGSDRVAFVHGDVRDHGYLKMVRDTAGKPCAKSPCDSQRQQFLKEGYSTSSAHPISSSPPPPHFFALVVAPALSHHRATLVSKFGGIDVWVNNAGVGFPENSPKSRWRDMVKINLVALIEVLARNHPPSCHHSATVKMNGDANRCRTDVDFLFLDVEI